MKPFLAIGAGFVSAIAMFAGGVAVATTVLTAEPQRGPGRDADVSDIWSSEPRTVDAGNQEFQRVASIAPVDQPKTGSVATDGSRDEGGEAVSDPGVDPTHTASIDIGDDARAPELVAHDAQREEAARVLVMDHIDWCSQRYRSYRPDDNSYQPYSGGRRECVSPYLEEAVAMMEAPSGEGEMRATGDQVGHAVEDGFSYQDEDEGYGDGGLVAIRDQFDGASTQRSALGADHVRDCFSRYRSYRVEDNSYQPYGGGPRRQCE